jgi:hypothetical protein
MKVRVSSMMLIMLAALILVFAPLSGVAAALQPVKSGMSNPEWLWQVEDLLYQSLRHNPKAPAVRGEALRLIHDIGYYLQRAGEAARLSNHELVETNAREAVSLLQRGVQKGYFQASDIAAVLEKIRRYLPAASV